MFGSPLTYDEPLFRPPSEADSLILQVTLGCSYNECSFCAMYRTKRFQRRPLDDLKREIAIAARSGIPYRRAFLADGDALVCSTRHLLSILETLHEHFPHLQRASIYSSPQALETKSVEELRELRDAGLTLHFLGVETGDDVVLARIAKGVTADRMIELGRRIGDAGAKLSTMVLNGMGGTDRWREHALGSARVINALQPRFLSTLTVTPVRGTPLHDEVRAGTFRLLDPLALTRELRAFVADLELDGTIFRSNHASNYLPLAGTFPRDKASILATLDHVLELEGDAPYRPEWQRGL